MPRDNGTFAGQGWSRKKEEAWERIFQQRRHDWLHNHTDEPFPPELRVPPEPPHEDLDERADRDEAAGWGR